MAFQVCYGKAGTRWFVHVMRSDWLGLHTHTTCSMRVFLTSLDLKRQHRERSMSTASTCADVWMCVVLVILCTRDMAWLGKDFQGMCVSMHICVNCKLTVKNHRTEKPLYTHHGEAVHNVLSYRMHSMHGRSGSCPAKAKVKGDTIDNPWTGQLKMMWILANQKRPSCRIHLWKFCLHRLNIQWHWG